jgi:hypothetical protein
MRHTETRTAPAAGYVWKCTEQANQTHRCKVLQSVTLTVRNNHLQPAGNKISTGLQNAINQRSESEARLNNI